jgi:gliding motility-associated-like protein
MKKAYLLILFITAGYFSRAQCPNLLSAMVNSCGANEGNNEFVVFSTSVTANASDYTFNYGSTNPPTVNNLSGSDATTPTGTGTVTTSGTCPVIQVTSPSTSIPAGSTVLFIPASYDQNYNVSSLCNGSSPIYVVFIRTIAAGGTNSNWSTTGTLSNSASTPRYLQVTYTGSTACNNANAPVQSYTASGNWPANTDGNLVYWNNTGAHYLNNGCNDISFHATGDTTVVACSSFTWHGVTYTSSTNTPTYTVTSATGYDSVVTLHLTINYPTSSDTTVVACSSFIWHGVTYTSSTNTPTYTTTNAANCDSVIHLHLTINNGTYTSASQTACGSYLWHGNTYNTSGTYIYNYNIGNGCSSADTLHLTINNPTNNVETQSVCGTYLWHGNLYTVSGTYFYNYTNANGCSSADTLHLSINNATHNSEIQTACGTYLWHGNSYTASGTYIYNYTNANGCNSADTLHLTIHQSNTGDTTVVACGNFTWYGINYSSTSTPTHVFTNNAGCDSIVTLHLTVNHPDTSITRINECFSELPISWNGFSYSSPGTYYVTIPVSNRCDSVAKLILNVKSNSGSSIVMNICASDLPYHWNNQSLNQSGTYQFSAVNAAGCDSTATLVLNIITDCNDIVFSNAFTPNNDGLNDSWGPIGNLMLIQQYELFVYNRWGEPVFISYNPMEKWKGKFLNQQLNSGNFVWFSTYTFKGVRKKQKGSLLLLK